MAEVLSARRPYINRDISWLDFNYRVLQEAKDKRLPLFERLKFLAIYSSNLDEFFRVRVANHRNLHRTGKKTRKTLDYDPGELLSELLEKVNDQQIEFSQIFFTQIVPELKENGINLIRRLELNNEQEEYLEDFFKEKLLPFVQPVLLIEDKIKPFLNNGSLYLALHLVDRKTGNKQYALVKVPSDQMSRFVELPSEPQSDDHFLIMLDDVVRHSIPWIFPGYDIKQSYSIKLTRDAELYIDDEFEGDLLEKIRKSLAKRDVGPASRLVYDREMPAEMLSYLKDVFELTKYDLLPEGRYHNNADFFKFPDFDKDYLKETPLKPIPLIQLEKEENIFHAISKRDFLIHPPYHSYEAVVKFFEDAADDPEVSHIKIVQYRVASKSRIMEALIKAANKGKHVSAFIEIKARFDESANITWGETLEKAGVQVHYSLPGIKVHAKVALIVRQENGRNATYAYLSTGNFHEGTANVYSDIGIFTKDIRLTFESVKIFNFLESKNRQGIQFKHLGVGLFNLNEKIDKLIKREIQNARQGLPAQIILKLNSLQDPKMIDVIYRAAAEGVEIKLIVRGLCSIVPGIPGVSENISGVSIVDRYLEHARIVIFHNNGNPEYFISSADWMYRNLYKRVEIFVPIYQEDLKKHIQALIDLQLSDNVKSRSLNYGEVNKYNQNAAHVLTRSQMDTYRYIIRKENELEI